MRYRLAVRVFHRVAAGPPVSVRNAAKELGESLDDVREAVAFLVEDWFLQPLQDPADLLELRRSAHRKYREGNR